ncbi:MAG TPA: integration host factor subunit beta [Candidatus Anaerofilum excrementigallinarum]|nr:integration host factor subunit beta [Candidatus Anaerofilum excrementigallinarum]
MTRSQLITKVSHDTGLPEAQVELVMNGLFDSIAESLKQGEKVTIAGFGRFEMRARKTKSFTNPKTKVSSQLEPTAIPGFKASGILKSKLGCKD